LGQHRAGGVVHAGQQVDRAAVGGGTLGATQGLAVDRDGPPPTTCEIARVLAVAVGQPRADGAGQHLGVEPAERAADGGLGRDAAVAGSVAAGAERGPDRLGCVGGPLGDRGDRPRPCRHCGGGQAQDGDQRVAAATGSSLVGDAGQVGEQVRGSLSWRGWAWASWARGLGSGMMGRQARASVRVMRLQ
jgi:hypothetical protein